MIDFVAWLYRWQTLAAGLVGGGLALVAAVIVYKAAIGAARQQIAAMRQAADDQIAAIQKHLADTQAARRQADEQKRSVIEWAVRAERRRLEAAIWALSPTGGGALPSGPQPASRRREQLVIESSALLRGEREDIALLDDRRRALLEDVAAAIDDYNSRIGTAVDPSGDAPLIVQATLDAFASLKELVGDLVA